MNDELAEEINYTLDTLVKSGFYSKNEILEVLKDQFIGEDIVFENIPIKLNNYNNSNFSKLEKAFEKLAKENIIAIHNCGYDMEEGVADAFELFIHLKNNKYNPIGFCFYSFEDIEEAIASDKLKIAFGDFEENEEIALKIGKTVANTLNFYNLPINWDQTINNQIEIHPFKWDKSFNDKKDYEIEGAFEVFKNGVNIEL